MPLQSIFSFKFHLTDCTFEVICGVRDLEVSPKGVAFLVNFATFHARVPFLCPPMGLLHVFLFRAPQRKPIAAHITHVLAATPTLRQMIVELCQGIKRRLTPPTASLGSQMIVLNVQRERSRRGVGLTTGLAGEVAIVSLGVSTKTF